MSTANLRRLLDKATARPWHGAHIFDGENVIQYGHDNAFRCHVAITQTEVDMDLIVELVNSADELLAENERLRAGLQRAARGLEKLGADEEDISDAYEALEQKP